MVETLYFNTYYSYLKGDLTKSKMFYEMLKEEFRLTKNPHILNRKQLKNLKLIKSCIDLNKIYSYEWVSEDIACCSNTQESKLLQKDLIRKIYDDDFKSFMSILGSDESIYMYNLEHPCGDKGFVDLVLKDKINIYPIEVKRGEGKHDLIGQIMKYNLHFKLHTHLKMYEEVVPATICNSYNKNTLIELKKLGVITITYNIIKNTLELKGI